MHAAKEFGCHFVSNDHFEDWQARFNAAGQNRMAAWLSNNKDRLRIAFMFLDDGTFLPKTEC